MLRLRLSWILTVVAALVPAAVFSPAAVAQRRTLADDKFRQLEETLPTPNTYRTASGAPGRGYWQQRADYDINVELDDDKQRLVGSETITYKNNSPDTLRYLWLQLDPNLWKPDSDAALTTTASTLTRSSFKGLQALLTRRTFDGGVRVTAVTENNGRPLKHTVVKTMMRVDLPQPLKTGDTFVFKVAWHYQINDAKLIRGRTGYEYFEADKNYIYEMAQWFPRMVSYTDVNGWQHLQYLGRGEFTLELGDYVVRITVPDDHIVGATGRLLNTDVVLTPQQRERLESAKKAKTPIFVVTPQEAKANEATKPTGKKTWIFKADNVRDFAFASSRKFIWDAQQHNVQDNPVMCMSLYPKEGEPLWSKYSTHAIIHTLDVYSRYTFKYPYPVAYSVNGPVGGMEYPMICFNGPRPLKDGTYSKGTKYGLISVIIHEVGHNYFPMIVNSDERQWTWMDEGLNTFLQYLAEQEWEEGYPSKRGEPRDIVPYMSSSSQVPIMTQSDAILQFGPNAYSKPATALNILRETVLGRELFDFAFKEYARRWRFKRPMPADFFRSIEDASSIDLDWFWRGWFYTTDNTDISIENVRVFVPKTGNPDLDKGEDRKKREGRPQSLSKKRNESLPKRADKFPELKDFYNSYDSLDVTDAERRAFKRYYDRLSDKEKKLLDPDQNFYVIDLKNIGGLVMPIILKLEYTDGTTSELRIPAEIWRRNSKQVGKMVITRKTLKSVVLDPHLETADVNLENNYFPRRIVKSRFQLFKQGRPSNVMQRQKKKPPAKKPPAKKPPAKKPPAKKSPASETASQPASKDNK